MCLSEMINIHKYPDEGTGWKIFNLRDEQYLVPEYICTNQIIPVNQWLHAVGGPLVGGYYGVRHPHSFTYSSGFHIYTRRRMERWNGCVARKVKYKGLTTVGTQDGKRVLVVQHILVLPKQGRR